MHYKPPFDYLKNMPYLTWKDAVWALNHNIFSESDLISLAFQRLSESSDALEYELAVLGEYDQCRAVEIASNLAEHEAKRSEDEILAKWLYVIIRYVIENPLMFPDPLAVIEEIYSDFCYPREIENLVRYMPILTENYDPSIHTFEENNNRLIENVKTYIQRNNSKWGL